MSNFSVTDSDGFGDGFDSVVSGEYSGSGSNSLIPGMPTLPGLSAGGGIDLGGGGPSSNDSTVNNDNGFTGGVINMGSSFGVPTWALVAGGAVVVYLMFGRSSKARKK